ncbi:putative prophage protein (partial) [Clostridium botulinum A str. ATCC 3502]|uniref:Prophage protein (Partial) n=2 Tax=Clostridium botulinum TaxID=1491 RepID=A5HZ24_CLOBH|nr:putative prophage protein (partial) [Clostridium botulinum A str. ATCC 3502]
MLCNTSLFKSFLEEYNGCEARMMAVLNVSMKIMKGELEFIRCGKYDYCKITKELKEIIHYKKL